VSRLHRRRRRADALHLVLQTFYALLRKTEPRDDPYDAGLFLFLLLVSQLAVPLVGISNFWTAFRGAPDDGLEDLDDDDDEDDVTPATGGGAASASVSASKGDGDVSSMEDDEKGVPKPRVGALRSFRRASITRKADGAGGMKPSPSPSSRGTPSPSPSPGTDPFAFANPYFNRVRTPKPREQAPPV
jgi:hypothetical protein